MEPQTSVQDRPRPRTRRDAKRKSREALIRAGIAEFAERGVDASSLDAICSRAGYTRGAFYVHFKDRDDFVAGVMERVLAEFLDTVIAGEGFGWDFPQLTERFASLLSAAMRGEIHSPLGVAGAKGGPGIRVLDLLAACASSRKVRHRLASLLFEASERLAKIAGEGQLAGGVRGNLDVEQVGILIVALAMGALVCADAGIRFEVDLARDTLLNVLRGD